jgi:hypothetical protein
MDAPVPRDGPVDQPRPDGPMDLPQPPDTGPPVTGCANGDPRTAFLDPAAFPTIAGCGAPVEFALAAQRAPVVCAAGWHWCKPEDVSASRTTTLPGASAGASCGWLADTVLASCGAKLAVHDSLGCGGTAARAVSTTQATGAACALVDLLCAAPWRLAVPLAQWNTSSIRSAAGACHDHAGVACASTLESTSCLVTCCRN